jgi:hypothetical protein
MSTNFVYVIEYPTYENETHFKGTASTNNFCIYPLWLI